MLEINQNQMGLQDYYWWVQQPGIVGVLVVKECIDNTSDYVIVKC